MDIILLVITVVSLIVAFVMSVTAARLARDEKQRSAARVAALSLAAQEVVEPSAFAGAATATADQKRSPLPGSPVPDLPLQKPSLSKAPWSAPRVVAEPVTLRTEAAPASISATGFLGATDIQRESGGRQKSLAFAAVLLFVVLSGGLFWLMSEPRGTAVAAAEANSPLELVSLTHQRQDQKLAVSGLVRNPAAGHPVEKLSAVVFLFDRAGSFVTSAKANVDFLKLGAGDESPFVVSLDAPASVTRYRVSFRTDEGIVPHVDRRDAAPAAEDVKD